MATYTHAGGIVFQLKNGTIYYLIVRAKPDTSLWVIPKGHLEPGESPEEAARREICEETGVAAEIIAPLGVLKFQYRGERIASIVYLLQYLRETPALEERECHWGTYEETFNMLTFHDTKELLALAQTALRQRGFEAP